jgi:hypothetical protein
MITRLVPAHTCVLLAAVLAAGCARTGELTGSVTHRGNPLDGGTVQVRGSDGIVRTAAIGPDGRYAIADLPDGPAAVSVTSPQPRGREPAPSSVRRGRESPGARTRGLPPGAPTPDPYSDLDQSGLSTTVRSGRNTFDFDLP